MQFEDDLFSAANLADPYPLYVRLRAVGEGLIRLPQYGIEVAARHSVAREVLRDHHTYRSGLGVNWIPVADAGFRAVFIENDPPAHTRVRRAVQRWCTPRAIGELQPVVDTIVGELVDDFVSNGGGDVMASLARRVPLSVMGEWLGLQLPPEATAWADASFRLGAPNPPPTAAAEFGAMLGWMFGDGLVAVRPGSFAEAILAGGDNDGLEGDERWNALGSIIIAGLDTTVHLIGNGIAALASHPDQFRRLVDEPERVAPLVVDETLRFDAPVRFFLRRTDDDRTVMVLYGSANRDEEVFERPERFDLERDSSAHLAFGSGIHLCLGAPLARLEGAAVFRALGEQVTGLEVGAGAQRTDSAAIRGFAQLPVRVDRRR
jgi:cytochrome P450